MRAAAVSLAVCCLSLSPLAAAEVAPAANRDAASGIATAEIGRRLENFELRDYRGKLHTLEDYSDSPVVVLAFMGVECPLAKLYGPRLADLAAELSDQGVTFLGINSNRHDTVTEIAAFARVHGVEFPILKDTGNVLADTIGATRTPQVFVLDAKRRVQYFGRIDDQYGFTEAGASYQQNAPQRRDLFEAVNELLTGQTVSQPTTAAPGCLIGRMRKPDEDAEVTYSNQIARLLNDRCVVCHREGQIAPFPLTTYDETVGWAEMIEEVVQQRRMPPWHADPSIGHFSNDARLSDEDMELVSSWVAAGAPEGDASQLPEPPEFAEGWQISEPDEVIYMADEKFDVPAEGVVDYQEFVVDPGWEEDKWIAAVEARPGNMAVVHHILVFVSTPRAVRRGGPGQLDMGWLAAYAPGIRQEPLPPHMARFVPAGSKLIFQLHYTPNGSPQEDLSYMGVVFADASEVRKEVAVQQSGDFAFKIPPGDPNYRVEADYIFGRDAMLLTLMPHMHLRGKDFSFEAIYPDGTREMLLSVPQYDFGWQTIYTLAEPKPMPAGSKLHCVAHFDNSEDNLHNPDPTKTVYFGEQTWDEMMIGFFEMALADQDLIEERDSYVSRVEQFMNIYKVNGTQLDETARLACRELFEHEDGFDQLCFVLHRLLPQLDRFCITYVEDGKLRLYEVEELPPFRGVFRSTSTRYDAEDHALADFAAGSEMVVLDDLASQRGSVMRRMAAKGIQSSVHIPGEHDGLRGTLNFWSLEENAFPPEAIELIQAVVSQLDIERP